MKKLVISAVILSLLTLAVSCGPKKAPADSGAQSGEMPKNLTIFAHFGNGAAKLLKNNNEILGFKLMEELTGTHVEWIHPSSEAVVEKFNLMIASGELPDLIVHNWDSIQGGAQTYVDDEVIVPLTELVAKYMPNLSAFNKERPEVKKQYTMDNGEILFLPFIRKDPELKIFLGPQIRQDWVETLGLSMPKTTDELYNVLTAFKTRDPNGNNQNDEIPMSGVGFNKQANGIGNLVWAFGTHYDFYLDGGKVKYGIMEDRFEEALAYVHKLFAEGLIDIDYLLNDRNKMDAKVMNDRVGFVFSYQPTKLAEAMKDKNPQFKIRALNHLKGPHGDNNTFVRDYYNDITSVSIAITTANPNPVGTAKWLDNFFGGKGMEFMNFGEEGKTFNWVDGYPKMTDYMLNNPDGTEKSSMFSMNIGAYESSFPTIQDYRYYEQVLSPAGTEAISIWKQDVDVSGIMPKISFTPEEQAVVTKNMSQISTFVDEAVDKIVLGERPLSDIPAIRERVRSMGIDEVLANYQNAVERFNKR